MKAFSLRRLALLPLAVLAVQVAAPDAFATHSWNGYHWARTANPFTLMVGDNVSSQWDSVLVTTIGDWSKSTVLDLTEVAGGASNKRCGATAGRVEVCNGTYGQNGWLGVASVWVSGGTHITQGTVKLNDTYFNTATYNTTAWRNLVSCQEVGHTLGLDHQDTNFDNPNLGTCMDYTRDPSTNQHPNQHDYDELVTIYTHLDSTSTVGSSPASIGAANGDLHGENDWGTAIRYANGKPILFARSAGADTVFTWVTWAE